MSRARPFVDTSLGRLAGATDGDVCVFRGIPFAAPPVGERRFLPPLPAAPWSGIRDASGLGPAPPQTPDPLSALLGLGFDVPIDEDALHLNITTPAADAGRRPVMVWLHGGAFASGSGNAPIYDASRLAARGDAVVVTLNYRVGALGFLHLAPLLAAGAPGGTGANLGLQDQIAALSFVRREIAAFGGDPECVTVFGESAGAGSIVALLAMPGASGLFRRAIIQSAAPDGMLDGEEAADRARQLLDRLGIGHAPLELRELQALPIEAILDAQQACIAAGPHRTGMFFAPVIDGETLPARPLTAIEAGDGAPVEILIGTTREEMRLYAIVPGMGDLDDATLERSVASRVSGDRTTRERIAREAIQAYRNGSRTDGAPPSRRDLFFALESDLSLRVPSTRIATANARAGRNTFMYLFTWESAFPDGRGGTLGACHALDLPFVFGTLDSAAAKAFVGEGDAPRALSDRVMDAWLAFARSGDPSTPSLGPWPPYDAAHRRTMLLGRSCGPIEAPLESQRAVWDRPPAGRES